LKNKPYRYGLYLIARFLVFMFRLMPRRTALALASGLGSLAFNFLVKERKKTLNHLRLAYDESKSEEEINLIASKVFVNCAKSAVDWIFYPRYDKFNWRKIVLWEDELDRSHRVLALGKGTIFVTAHLGNWEMLAATYSFFGFPLSVVARRVYYEPYNQWIMKARLSKSLRTIYQDDSPKELLKAIKANQPIGIVADQDVDAIGGIFVPFFGHLAYTTTAPAKLSLATGSPIVPIFLIRNEDDTYRILLEDPIFPDSGAEKNQEIERLTRLWSASIEEKVRLFPEQWVWMHRRWKTRPPQEEVKNVVSPIGEEKR